MSTDETSTTAAAGPVLSEGLGPLPVPEILHEVRDAPCPVCNAMLRALPPIKMGYTEAQMRRYAAEQVAAERERWTEALQILRDAVRAQNRAGTSWPTPVFAQMMDGLARADTLLDGPNDEAKRPAQPVRA